MFCPNQCDCLGRASFPRTASSFPIDFCRLPQLLELKQRLQAEGCFQSVFMTGSGSTIVCVGADEPPGFLFDEAQYGGLFLSPARLITRQQGQWYHRHARGISRQEAAFEEALGC